MKERPILFNGPMVRAILEGRKTQTRRVVTVPWVRGQRCRPEQSNGFFVADGKLWFDDGIHEEQPCPYGVPGDLLWVRETWGIDHLGGYQSGPSGKGKWIYEIYYRAGGRREIEFKGSCSDDPYVRLFDTQIGDWRPSIHMPRWASRITLRVTNVRVERVQEISEADAIAEGIDRVGGTTSCTPWRNYNLKPGEPFAKNHASPLASFAGLWDSINARRGYGWDVNPWVWVVEFERVESV